MGNACAQAGHSRSSHSMMATFAPGGGFSMDVSLNVSPCPAGTAVWACAAQAASDRNKAAERSRYIAIGRKRTPFESHQDSDLNRPGSPAPITHFTAPGEKNLHLRQKRVLPRRRLQQLVEQIANQRRHDRLLPARRYLNQPSASLPLR